ncbi:MAG: D-lyxose/D-mannose family sugar isomerase [Clostridia bacterium]|nr:D-lyxose/D-mannose family sugar isomerase [Clostridia bacterium]
MITREQLDQARRTAAAFFEKAGIVLTEEEKAGIEVADFGLGDLWRTGLEDVTYVNTERVCAKEMVVTPGQTCPEHKHPELNGRPGKEETFRCRFGTVYLYVDGEPVKNPAAVPPQGVYTVFHEIILHPGMQYTLLPGTLHWFQGWPQGAVVSEFSTTSHDESDIFTDERIRRAPEIA